MKYRIGGRFERWLTHTLVFILILIIGLLTGGNI